MRLAPECYFLLASVLTALAAMPASGASQERAGLSAEVGVGQGYAGHGIGPLGKFIVRTTPTDWGVGVRVVAMDGVRREATACSLFCNPLESFREKSVMVHRRIVTSAGSRIFVAAGWGRLTGSQFVGSTSELEEVSQWGLALGASGYWPPGERLFRFAAGANAHVRPGGVSAGLTIGFALAR